MGIRLSTADRRKLLEEDGTSPFKKQSKSDSKLTRSRSKTRKKKEAEPPPKATSVPKAESTETSRKLGTIRSGSIRKSGIISKIKKTNLDKTQMSSEYANEGPNDRKKKSTSRRSSLHLADGKSPVTSYSIFAERCVPLEAHPRKARHIESEPENTKAEKPLRRMKFKRKFKGRAGNTERSTTSKITDRVERKTTKKSSELVKACPVRSQTIISSKSIVKSEYHINMETFEDNAFITEAANKPAPKTENFFALANPFTNERDMLDISDTLFDVASDFPNMFLTSKIPSSNKTLSTQKLEKTQEDGKVRSCFKLLKDLSVK